MTLSFQLASAQNAVTLDSCIVWAKRNYPLIKQNGLLADYSNTNIQSINENWYPKLSFLARATYNTEVVAFNFPGMNISFPHDAYLANVTLDQTIFDGGQTGQQKRIERVSADLEIQKNEVELYKLVDRITQLYVNILLSRENLKILNVYKDDIENKQKNIQASIQNGLALQSNIDELEAEKMKTEQSVSEVQENLRSLYETLTTYIARPLGDQTVFSMTPLGGEAKSGEVMRPELKMLALQQELLDSRYKLTNKLALPRIALGVGANYGRPGPNFINQDLRFFGDANISVRWNISSLYGLSREKNKFQLNQQMVDIQREVFLLNIKNALSTQTAQINSLQDMIAKDRVIIEKRHNVTTTASSQLENGRITVTDYLTQLNAEMQATLNQKLHEIKLMNAMTTYNTTRGINNF